MVLLWSWLVPTISSRSTRGVNRRAVLSRSRLHLSLPAFLQSLRTFAGSLALTVNRFRALSGWQRRMASGSGSWLETPQIIHAPRTAFHSCGAGSLAITKPLAVSWRVAAVFLRSDASVACFHLLVAAVVANGQAWVQCSSKTRCTVP
jgi:hypothetical protein